MHGRFRLYRLQSPRQDIGAGCPGAAGNENGAGSRASGPESMRSLQLIRAAVAEFVDAGHNAAVEGAGERHRR